jgi:hypothetical protein
MLHINSNLGRLKEVPRVPTARVALQQQRALSPRSFLPVLTARVTVFPALQQAEAVAAASAALTAVPAVPTAAAAAHMLRQIPSRSSPACTW